MYAQNFRTNFVFDAEEVTQIMFTCTSCHQLKYNNGYIHLCEYRKFGATGKPENPFYINNSIAWICEDRKRAWEHASLYDEETVKCVNCRNDTLFGLVNIQRTTIEPRNFNLTDDYEQDKKIIV